MACDNLGALSTANAIDWVRKIRVSCEAHTLWLRAWGTVD